MADAVDELEQADSDAANAQTLLQALRTRSFPKYDAATARKALDNLLLDQELRDVANAYSSWCSLDTVKLEPLPLLAPKVGLFLLTAIDTTGQSADKQVDPVRLLGVLDRLRNLYGGPTKRLKSFTPIVALYQKHGISLKPPATPVRTESGNVKRRASMLKDASPVTPVDGKRPKLSLATDATDRVSPPATASATPLPDASPQTLPEVQKEPEHQVFPLGAMIRGIIAEVEYDYARRQQRTVLGRD